MATFIRKLFGQFGGKKDNAQRKPAVRSEEAGGFGVKLAGPADARIHVPVVSRSACGDGGVQGLKWYVEKLRVDDDGDIAQEFFSEVNPGCIEANHQGRRSRLKPVAQTKPAILNGPVCTQDGNVFQDAQSPLGNLWA